MLVNIEFFTNTIKKKEPKPSKPIVRKLTLPNPEPALIQPPAQQPPQQPPQQIDYCDCEHCRAEIRKNKLKQQIIRSRQPSLQPSRNPHLATSNQNKQMLDNDEMACDCEDCLKQKKMVMMMRDTNVRKPVLVRKSKSMKSLLKSYTPSFDPPPPVFLPPLQSQQQSIRFICFNIC